MRLLFITLTLLVSSATMAIEEPPYTTSNITENNHGVFELRHYAPLIIAETLISGSMDDASSKGFKKIAAYIFGNNTLAEGESTKIAMTAPVTMEPGSTKIKMTAPATLEKQDGKWLMYFVMPSEYSLATLPRPNNPEVVLKEIPAKQYAVLRFSGLTGERKVAKKTNALLAWLKTSNITPKGTPALARYNHPFTLPFLRRNEILVKISP
jgi:hypothetical protein